MSISARIWISVAIAASMGWVFFTVALYPQPQPLDEQLETFGRITDSNDNWHRGVLLHKSGDREAALTAYDQAIAINPEALYAYLYRGKLKYDSGDYDGAIADYTAAIELDPDFLFAINARSVARYRAGDKEGADADLALALKQNPIFPAINKAIMTRLDGNVEQALRQFERLRAETPSGERTAPQILENIGTIKLELGDLEGALEAYNALLSQWPSKFRGYQMRATIHEALGHSAEAQSDQSTYQNLYAQYRVSLLELQSDLNKAK